MNAPRPTRPRTIHPRRGLSLVTVMAPLSAAVVLSVAVLSSQTTAVQSVQNVSAGELARQSAETGLAAALDAIQDPAWGGVSSPLTAEVGRDSSAVWSYNITFSQVPSDGSSEIASSAAALKLRVRSTGIWQALGGARPVSRAMEAVVSLTPRLPGRTSRPGDVATANDRATDVAGFSTAQAYTVFTAGGSNSYFIEPQTRVAGDLYLSNNVKFCDDLVNFSSTQIDDLLTGLGKDYGGGPGAASPHPIAGKLYFPNDPGGGDQSDLTRLGVPWAKTASALPLPTFSPADFQTYRLYSGGLTYSAVPVGPTLQNQSLGPTDANPLGIFFCNGSLTVGDGVVVRGTLVATSGITFQSSDAAVTAMDWRDGAGGTPVTDRNLWPILPAVVAGGNVTFTSSNRSMIEGAVLSNGDVVANAPGYARESTTVVYLGNGTAKPLGGGLSEVSLTDLSILLNLGASSKNEVRIGGAAGRWYPVTSVNALLGGTITVRGTADFPTTTSVEIQPRRYRYSDIAGPVIAQHVVFNASADWTGLTGSTVTSKYNAWKNECATRSLLLSLIKPRTFGAYLADSANWLLAGSPYGSYGLPFDPTVSVCRPANVSYACGQPLFRPDPSARTAGGGYHWTVLSWREVTP